MTMSLRVGKHRRFLGPSSSLIFVSAGAIVLLLAYIGVSEI